MHDPAGVSPAQNSCGHLAARGLLYFLNCNQCHTNFSEGRDVLFYFRSVKQKQKAPDWALSCFDCVGIDCFGSTGPRGKFTLTKQWSMSGDEIPPHRYSLSSGWHLEWFQDYRFGSWWRSNLLLWGPNWKWSIFIFHVLLNFGLKCSGVSWYLIDQGNCIVRSTPNVW